RIEQAPELELAIERNELVGARLAEAKPPAIEGDRTVRDDGREFSALARLIRMRLQEAAELVPLHLGQVREKVLDGAELADELLRRLLADALDAGNVVGGVSHKAHHLDDPRRLDAEPVQAVLLGQEFVLDRIIDADRRRQQLE